MFEGVISFFKKFAKSEEVSAKSKDTAKERLHLVLMQDRANVSADFLEMMKQEIIEVIKKYIDVEEKEIDVKLTNKTNEDGSIGAPALYANIPIAKIKNENELNKSSNEKSETIQDDNKDSKREDKKEEEKKDIKSEKKSEITGTNKEIDRKTNKVNLNEEKKEIKVETDLEETNKNEDNKDSKGKEKISSIDMNTNKKINTAKPKTSKKKKK